MLQWCIHAFTPSFGRCDFISMAWKEVSISLLEVWRTCNNAVVWIDLMRSVRMHHGLICIQTGATHIGCQQKRSTINTFKWNWHSQLVTSEDILYFPSRNGLTAVWLQKKLEKFIYLFFSSNMMGDLRRRWNSFLLLSLYGSFYVKIVI